MHYFRITFVATVFLFAAVAGATIFGSVSGLIHDPQHRPIQGAQVTLKSQTSDWSKNLTSNDAGEFLFEAVPLGDFTVTVAMSGFATQEQKLSVRSGGVARLHFALTVANVKETVQVTDELPPINPESSTTQSVVSHQQIMQTPGADQTNSLTMITDYVPGAYMVHDQLHIRGGHQVSWLIDGVPVPNTSIASNVGPQFDPKDIDEIEVQRGGYSAEYGDRTYGVFNVVTRSGFERNRQGELVLNYGSFNNTNDQLSFGDHTNRFAYYGSLSGYRTDLGLETSSTEILHDQAAGLSAFGSVIFNKSPTDQLRLVTSVRGDHYQVPNDPDQQAAGIRDVENERDSFVNFTWLHTAANGVLLTVSPFYHFNRAHYLGGPNDPVRSEYDRGSNYVGGVTTVAITKGRHNFHAGFQVFGERDNQFYSVVAVPGSSANFAPQRKIPWANVEAVFLEEQFKATSWLTFNGGLRISHYGGPVSENAADPRIGAAVQVPRLHWVARAFWGRYFQAPPLVTVTNPALNADQNFLPLHGERDEQREFGLTIPLRAWTFDIANFRTAARNFFDHDALGNSNIFFPLTLERARIRGWEATATTPTVAGRAKFHLAYSHQHAEWSGGITGGLISDEACEDPICTLDHDQRDTLSTGVNFNLPWHSTANFNLNYGSGFLNGDGKDIPTHLPSHTTFDLSLGKSFGENWSVGLTGLNLSNHRYLLDQSNTFGGTHYVNPRELSVQLRYRFKY